MKNYIVILFLVAAANSYGQTAKDFKKLDWLSGTWTRTNAKAGRSGFETWSKVTATEFKGRGITMKGADTSYVEKIKIITKNDQLYYVADVPDNSEPILFKFTQITDKGFVCENPQHDFPKKIEYQLDGKNLKAVISGDGKAVDYLFVKKEI